MKRFAAILTVAVALIAPAALCAPAEAASVSASSGSVTAELSYSPDPVSSLNVLGNLKVTRAGTVAYDAPVDVCGGQCFLAGDPADPTVLQVLDLDADGEPEIVAPAYTGGAHCCIIASILRYQPATSSYLVTKADFGDAGYTIADLDNDLRPEITTADTAFAYRFTSFAQSGMPTVILRFDHGTFSDVSKTFPAALRKDASTWRSAIRHNIKHGKLVRYGDVRGYYAAWAADQYRLGKGSTVNRALNTALRRHWLKGNGIGKQNAAYVRDLLAFLKRTGYR